MSTKRFTVLPNVEEPLEFELATPEGEVLGLFHFTRRPRLDIALGLSQAVTLNNGKRDIDKSMLLYVLRELMIKELRDPETGLWSPADDRERFDELMANDRYLIDDSVLVPLTLWLTEEFSGHPTGASSLS